MLAVLNPNEVRMGGPKEFYPDQEELDSFMDFIQTNGQTIPVIVQNRGVEGYYTSGNDLTMWIAMEKLGFDMIIVSVI